MIWFNSFLRPTVTIMYSDSLMLPQPAHTLLHFSCKLAAGSEAGGHLCCSMRAGLCNQATMLFCVEDQGFFLLLFWSEFVWSGLLGSSLRHMWISILLAYVSHWLQQQRQTTHHSYTPGLDWGLIVLWAHIDWSLFLNIVHHCVNHFKRVLTINAANRAGFTQLAACTGSMRGCQTVLDAVPEGRFLSKGYCISL